MRVLITRPRMQAIPFAEELKNIGAEPIFLPTIAIQHLNDTSYLDNALSQLRCYDWLILTSVNAADVVLGRLLSLGIDTPPANLQIAAIGPRTADRLKVGGIHPDFVPDRYIAESIIPGLGDLRERWVLLPMADIANNTLPSAIQFADGIAHVITAYHTVLAEPDPEGLSALQTGVDVVTFTSGSTARNLFIMAKNAGLDPLNLPGNPKITCIGPKTAQIARDLGFTVDIIADEYTTAGLVQALNVLI